MSESVLRHELKFGLEGQKPNAVREFLMKSSFRTIHEDRVICSVYLDTPDLRCFFETKEGLLPRSKFRFRWYGSRSLELSSARVMRFEVKQSLSHIRSKSVTETCVRNLGDFEISDGSYGHLGPVCAVSYRRSYMMRGTWRVTFDRDIAFHFITSRGISRGIDDPDKASVVEVKIGPGSERDAVLESMSLPFTQFSKYERAMDFLSSE